MVANACANYKKEWPGLFHRWVSNTIDHVECWTPCWVLNHTMLSLFFFFLHSKIISYFSSAHWTTKPPNRQTTEPPNHQSRILQPLQISWSVSIIVSCCLTLVGCLFVNVCMSGDCALFHPLQFNHNAFEPLDNLPISDIDLHFGATSFGPLGVLLVYLFGCIFWSSCLYISP